MQTRLKKTWQKNLQTEFKKTYFKALIAFVEEQYSAKKVFPLPENIFLAFERCPFEDVRVIIIGQDPYHGIGQAHGLCFSVPTGVKIPPSLMNIYKELENDLGIKMGSSGNLSSWSRQGILLLNSTLTVQAQLAGSHQKKGWEEFTDQAIKVLSHKRENLVFLLWGAYAQKKTSLIDESKHLILKAPHPSPLSAHRGFLGCKHFSKTNKFLSSKGIKKIKWQID